MSPDDPPDSNSVTTSSNTGARPVVLVLAGGLSNRLWPLHDKLLIEYGSQTLLERHLRLLEARGCDRFVVVARPEQRDAVVSIGAGIRGAVEVVDQPEARGMADAVLCARSALDRFGDAPLYVTQAHDVVDGDLHTRVLDRWAGAGCDGLLAASRVSSYFPGGYLTLDGERVTSVVEKPGAGNEPSDLVNLVAHVFGSWRSLVAAIESENSARGGETAWGSRVSPPTSKTDRVSPPTSKTDRVSPPTFKTDDVYERALSRLMRTGDFGVVVHEGRWQGLKYPWHVLDVMDLLLERWANGSESPGPEYEQREEGVFVGRNLRIFPGAYLVAPVLIGHDCVVGHNALVRGSIIGNRSVVGFGSEVARSYLGEGVELHHNYVGDSVFGAESAMGYGAVTANYRLDGRTVPMFAGKERIDTGRMKLGLILGAHARIGVNTSTMPGVKIGAKAMVGPNLRVTKDLPDGARMMNDGEYGRL